LSLELWLAFVAAAAVVLVIPGPTILTVISYSLAHGRRAAVPLVAAVVLGDSTALIMSIIGLGALLAASALWFSVVKWTGGLYLLFLGVKLLRAKDSPIGNAGPSGPGSRRGLFLNTWLVTALNPKGIVFFVAFLPQFINPGQNASVQIWALAATFVVMAMINAALYAVFAAGARRVLESPRSRRRFNLAGGSLLAAAGIWALLARRPA
jgi:threonine/homoserine/homoserine lactone efflux protein